MDETCFGCGVDTNWQETVYVSMVNGRMKRFCSKDCKSSFRAKVEEKLRCPECHSEFDPEDLRHATSLGCCLVYCPACRMWQDRDMYNLVVDHTCANCRFQQNDHCSRIVQELNMYTINVTVKPEFSCSLWKECEDNVGPFEIVQECNHGLYRIDSSVSLYAGPHLYAKAQAEELRDWLNLQWNERKE